MMTARHIIHCAFGKGAITYAPVDVSRNTEAQTAKKKKISLDIVVGSVC